MGMIGHNGGPTMEPGQSWRKHCWSSARAALLPTLPIEVLRNRVRRAAELGLDYKTYASVRAQTGHDVVAFLFSSNALRAGPVSPAMPGSYAVKLERVEAGKIGLAVAPLATGMLEAANPQLDRASDAPWALASWPQMREQIRSALGNLPADRVALIGGYAAEREWVAAGRLAAFVPEAQYFAR